MIFNGPSQIINPLARERRCGFGGGVGGGGGGFTGPLDSLSTGIFAAISSRRLFSSFAGSPMNLRIQPGATVADIPFSSDFTDVDSTARTALLGSSDGRIVTAYDQTGLGSRDFTQGTAVWQPTVKYSGSVDTVNSKQAFRGDTTGAGSMWLACPSVAHGIGTGDFMFSLIIKRGTLNTAGRALASIGTLSPAVYTRAFGPAPEFYIGGGPRAFNTTLSLNTVYVLTFTRESGTLKCYINGTAEATTHADTTNIPTSTLQILSEGTAGSAASDDSILEAIFATSVANRAAIIANQRTYAGV